MAKRDKPNMEIQTLDDDDLDSVSGGHMLHSDCGSTCHTGHGGTCVTGLGGACETSGSGTCMAAEED